MKFNLGPISRIRLSSTLAFIETSNGSITPPSLSAITAASQLSNPITALLAGSDASQMAKEVAKLKDVKKIIIANDAKFNHYLAEQMTPLMIQILSDGEISHVIAPSSAAGKSLLPRVAALKDVQPLTDIMKVVSADTFVRPIYAGNALATVKSKDSLIMATVRTASFAPAVLGSDPQDIPITEVSTPEISTGAEFVSENLVKSERPDLGSASVVVSGGRGLKNKEGFESIIEPLATTLKAAIGASRAAVDAGFCDNSLQVGQTGKIVSPDLYISVGISGAIQHLAGMKDAKTIVAINKDEESAIFNVADIGVVGDLFEIVPEFTKLVQEAK